jgi:hypothetical protein
VDTGEQAIPRQEPVGRSDHTAFGAASDRAGLLPAGGDRAGELDWPCLGIAHGFSAGLHMARGRNCFYAARHTAAGQIVAGGPGKCRSRLRKGGAEFGSFGVAVVLASEHPAGATPDHRRYRARIRAIAGRFRRDADGSRRHPGPHADGGYRNLRRGVSGRPTSGAHTGDRHIHSYGGHRVSCESPGTTPACIIWPVLPAAGDTACPTGGNHGSGRAGFSLCSGARYDPGEYRQTIRAWA